MTSSFVVSVIRNDCCGRLEVGFDVVGERGVSLLGGCLVTSIERGLEHLLVLARDFLAPKLRQRGGPFLRGVAELHVPFGDFIARATGLSGRWRGLIRSGAGDGVLLRNQIVC